MKLFEYQAKGVLQKHGIPIPKGFVVSSAKEISEVPGPVMVKAQVLIGGRGKAGGVRAAESLDEAREAASRIIGMDIGGHKARQALVEDRLDIVTELYLGITVDRSKRSLLLMASPKGGVEIESVPDDDIMMMPIDPLIGYQPFMGRTAAFFLGVERDQRSQIEDLCEKLHELVVSEDAELAEVNPLVITRDGKVIAGDAKIIIDSDALFRHEEYASLSEELTPLEQKARSMDIAFVQLDGDIGVIANGAGLTMATLDSLKNHGGNAGVFLDLGGTDDPDKVKRALLLMREAGPKVILLNIFGGITKCDTVAEGVLEAADEARLDIPVVARIKGVNEEVARDMLKDAGLIAASGLSEAAEKASREAGR